MNNSCGVGTHRLCSTDSSTSDISFINRSSS